MPTPRGKLDAFIHACLRETSRQFTVVIKERAPSGFSVRGKSEVEDPETSLPETEECFWAPPGTSPPCKRLESSVTEDSAAQLKARPAGAGEQTELCLGHCSAH